MIKRKVIGVVFLLLSVVTVYLGASYLYKMYDNNKQQEKIQATTTELKNTVKLKQSTGTIKDNKPKFKDIDWGELYEMNKDTKYWLEFPEDSDIQISEPITQTNNNDTYVWKPFIEGTANDWGNPFMDYRSSIDDTYKLIYGHSFSSNDYQFTRLKKFVDKEGIIENEKNHRFYLYYPKGDETVEIRVYRIFSIIDSTVEHDAAKPVAGLESQEYKDFVNILKDDSVYDFDVKVPDNADLLSLYTCRHPNSDYRLYVVGFLESSYEILD